MKKNRIEFYVTVFVWFVVIGIAWVFWTAGDPDIKPAMTLSNILIAATLFVIYIVGYVISQFESKSNSRIHIRLLGLCLAGTSVLGLSLFYFFMIPGVLATVLAPQLLDFVKQRTALVIAIAFPLLCVTLDGYLKGLPFYFESFLLFAVLNSLVLLSSYRLIEERKAKDESRKLVRELSATQILLSSTAKRDERLRIARDLHDALGHQLIALKLQLEVASHVGTEAVHEHIRQAKTISDALFNDVREAVSEIRARKDHDLHEALYMLTQNIPGLHVDLQINLDESQLSAQQVEVIFRIVQEAITNSIKHGNADHCRVSLNSDNSHHLLLVEDNGRGIHDVNPGNGLTGMAERVKKMDGLLDYQVEAKGFKLMVRMPKVH